MFVIGIETYSDIREFGSQRKVSVERPDTSGIMPDLSYKAPTCENRDSSFYLHGKVGLFISQLRDRINASAMTVLGFSGMDNYKNNNNIVLPRKFIFLLQILISQMILTRLILLWH